MRRIWTFFAAAFWICFAAQVALALYLGGVVVDRVAGQEGAAFVLHTGSTVEVGNPLYFAVSMVRALAMVLAMAWIVLFVAYRLRKQDSA